MTSAAINDPPIVSIGLPVYNGESYLVEAIDSVQSQVFQDWELIICDNASTDSTATICQRYLSDKRISYHRNDTNIGLYANFRKALSLARGEYFKWMAHDDVCLPRFISQCLEGFAANPRASIVFVITAAIDETGTEIPGFFYNQSPLIDRDASTRFRKIIHQFTLDNGRSAQVYTFGLIRMSSLQSVRSMRVSDLNLVADLAIQGHLSRVDEPLLMIRQHPEAHHLSIWRKGRRPSEIDPSIKSRFRLQFLVRKKYWEYVCTAAAADLPLGAKAGLIAFTASVPARRLFRR